MTAEPTSKLPEVTVEELLSRGPCWTENKVRAALSGRERWTALDILAASDKDIPHHAKLWVILHPQASPSGIVLLAVCWCVRHTPLGDGRTVWGLLTDKRSRRAVEVVERYARGQATQSDIRDAYAAAAEAHAAYNAAYAAHAARAEAHAAYAAAAAHAARAAARAAYAAYNAAHAAHAAYAAAAADAADAARAAVRAARAAARAARAARLTYVAAADAAVQAQIRGIERLIREYAQTGELPEIESET